MNTLKQLQSQIDFLQSELLEAETELDNIKMKSYIDKLTDEQLEAESKMTKFQRKYYLSIDAQEHEFGDFALSNLTSEVFNNIVGKHEYLDHPLHDELEEQLRETEMAWMIQNLSKQDILEEIEFNK